jgi:alkylation response protein AidB-like acyl-CoA dehydrogenase
VSGETVAAFAVDEGRHHRPREIALKAERSGNGFSLSGTKQFVVHGASADVIIVAARTGGSPGEPEGLTLFAVPRDAAGMTSRM